MASELQRSETHVAHLEADAETRGVALAGLQTSLSRIESSVERSSGAFPLQGFVCFVLLVLWTILRFFCTSTVVNGQAMRLHCMCGHALCGCTLLHAPHPGSKPGTICLSIVRTGVFFYIFFWLGAFFICSVLVLLFVPSSTLLFSSLLFVSFSTSSFLFFPLFFPSFYSVV